MSVCGCVSRLDVRGVALPGHSTAERVHPACQPFAAILWHTEYVADNGEREGPSEARDEVEGA